MPQVSGSLLGGDVVIQFVRRVKLPDPNDQPHRAPKHLAGRRYRADGRRQTPDEAARQIRRPRESRDESVHDGDYIEGSVAPNAFQVIGNLEGELSTAITLVEHGRRRGRQAGRLSSTNCSTTTTSRSTAS